MIENEYLSTAKWDELHQALARALTPAAIAEWPGAHENALDQAATVLGELGVMPEEPEVKIEVDVKRIEESLIAGFWASLARAERTA